jgi:beta-lactamase superfamily II metal-dependent hydrolase
MMLRYGATRILLAADAEAEAEHRMVRAGLDLKADVLKVGHHGSNGATSDRWLNAVLPQVAVISVGKTNAFGHPDPRVLRRLSRHGTRILRTDVTGSITVWSDGRTCRITTQRRMMN